MMGLVAGSLGTGSAAGSVGSWIGADTVAGMVRVATELLCNPNELAITAWILAGIAKRTAVFSRLLQALSWLMPAAVSIPANLFLSNLLPFKAVDRKSVV